jgi:ABC-type glycerol-3-phosphate transport system substrate-binding protein
MLCRRFILPLLLILLAACSPAAPPPPTTPPADPTITTITFGVANHRLPEYAPQIEQFEAQNPDIDIQTVALDTVVVADTADAAQTLDAIARVADTSVIAAGLRSGHRETR